MKPLFGLNGSCSLAIILGFISGYPIGAKTAVDLYIKGSCSKSEAEKVLAFCNNSGPMFIVGAVGVGMMKSAQAGWILYTSQIISALIVALIMRNIPTAYHSVKKDSEVHSFDFGSIFTDAISSSVLLILTVCGFVVIFALLLSFIEKLGVIHALSSFGIKYSFCKSVIYGFLECTGGAKQIVLSTENLIYRYMLVSSVLAWSGLSVHLQVLGIIKKAKLSPKLYFKGKVLMAIISPVVTLIILGVFRGKISPFALILPGILVFAVSKTISTLKKIYSKYLALPPR